MNEIYTQAKTKKKRGRPHKKHERDESVTSAQEPPSAPDESARPTTCQADDSESNENGSPSNAPSATPGESENHPQSTAATPTSQGVASGEPDTAARLIGGVLVTVGRVNPADLRAHAVNDELYSAKDSVEDLVEDIKLNGFIDPPVTTDDKVILVGHRRVRAAIGAGLKEIEVHIFHSADETKRLQLLLGSNSQRIKTNSQTMREGNLRLRLKKEITAKRKAALGEGENLPPPEKGKLRDIVGSEMGVSGRTLDNGIKILEAVDTLKKEGKEQEAEELIKQLDKSVDGALKLATAEGLIGRAAKKIPIEPPTEAVENARPKGRALVTGKGKQQIDVHTNRDASLPNTATKLQSDSEAALEKADEVITFLRQTKPGTLSKDQERTWKRVFEEIVGLRNSHNL